MLIQSVQMLSYFVVLTLMKRLLFTHRLDFAHKFINAFVKMIFCRKKFDFLI